MASSTLMQTKQVDNPRRKPKTSWPASYCCDCQAHDFTLWCDGVSRMPVALARDGDGEGRGSGGEGKGGVQNNRSINESSPIFFFFSLSLSLPLSLSLSLPLSLPLSLSLPLFLSCRSLYLHIFTSYRSNMCVLTPAKLHNCNTVHGFKLQRKNKYNVNINIYSIFEIDILYTL